VLELRQQHGLRVGNRKGLDPEARVRTGARPLARRNQEDLSLADYTIVNLLEIDDSVGGRVPGMEGRFGRKHLESRDLGVSLWRYAPGTRNPNGHSHREQEEAYVVVAGSGRVRLDDDVRDIRLWDVVRVGPETVRAFEAGPDGLDLIAVGGPKPEGGDGVLSETPWPDAGDS
jgi:quercetin dioxygenase-like cupin family protein